MYKKWAVFALVGLGIISNAWAANTPPTVVLNHAAQVFLAGARVYTLDASGSFDADSDDISFSWREDANNPGLNIIPNASQLRSSNGSMIPNGSESLSSIPVSFPMPGRYVFEVQVVDSKGAVSDVKTITVYVSGLVGTVSLSPSDGLVRVPDVKVVAYANTTDAENDNSAAVQDVAITDSKGVYQLENVAPFSSTEGRQYFIRLSRDGFETPDVSSIGVLPDPGAIGDLTNFSISRGSLGVLRGVVSTWSSSTTTTPVANATVSIIPGLLGQVFTDTTDQNGIFEISDVPFGSWVMQLQGPGGSGYLPEARDLDVAPGASAVTNYSILERLNESGAEDYYGVDNPRVNAVPISDGEVQVHNFDSVDDRSDWVAFPTTANKYYMVETYFLGSRCDTMIQLYQFDSGNVLRLIAMSDDRGNGDISSYIGFTATGGTYYAKVMQRVSPTYGKNTAYMLRLWSADSFEPDDTAATASWIGIDSEEQAHLFEDAGDVDYSSFYASKGDILAIETVGLGPRCATRLRVYDSSNAELYNVTQRASGDPSSFISFIAPKDGKFIIAASHVDSTIYGVDTGYTLSARRDHTVQYIPLTLQSGVGSSRLSGKVTLSVSTGTDDSEIPIEGVTVTLGTGVAAKTNSNGVYTFNGIPSGYYVATLKKSGYDSLRVTNLWVAPGSSTASNFRMSFEGNGPTVSGYVYGKKTTSTTATVLRDVTVGVVRGYDGSTPILYPQDVTDATGYYQLKGVPEGTQVIAFVTPTAWGFTPDPSTITITVPDASDTEEANITMDDTVLVGGTHPTETTTVVAKVTATPVSANLPYQSILLDATTSVGTVPFTYSWREASDNPALGLLPDDNSSLSEIQVTLPVPGAYTFIVDAKDATNVASYRPAAITVYRPGIRGNVHISPSDGIWGIELATVRAYANYEDALNWTSNYIDAAVTSSTSNGDYQLNGLTVDSETNVGSYWITAKKDGYFQYGPVKRSIYSYGAAEILDINMAAEAHNFEGYVTDSNGSALEGARVILAPGIESESFRTTTDQNGYFRLSQVPGGTSWPVMFVKDGYQAETIFVDLDSNLQVEQVLTTLSSGNSEFVPVHGVVTCSYDGLDLPVAHAEVIFGFGLARAVTDATGYYEIPDLAPGDYYGVVRKAGYVSVQLSDSGIVTLNPGSDNTINFSLEFATVDDSSKSSGGSAVLVDANVLSGKIFDGSGLPVNGAVVSLLPPLGWNIAKSAAPSAYKETDFAGCFNMIGVPDGQQRIKVEFPDGKKLETTVVVEGDTNIVLSEDSVSGVLTGGVGEGEGEVGEGEGEGEGEGGEGEGEGEGEFVDYRGSDDSGAVAVWRVSADSTAVVPSGVTWNLAFSTLEQGVAAAATYRTTHPTVPVQVWVKAGTYDYARDSYSDTGSLELAEGVQIYGGFTGVETSVDAPTRDWLNNPSVIDGSTAYKGRAAYHVVTGAVGALIDGFFITGGRADGLDERGWGAGMYNVDCAPTIRRCFFVDNTAYWGGAAIYNDLTLLSDGSYPLIQRCFFESNKALTASSDGGAIYNLNSSSRIVNSVFASNSSNRYGGAIYNAYCSPTIINCSFNGNVSYYGGAIANLYSSTSTVKNSILWGDVANYEIYNVTGSSASVSYSDVKLDSGVYSGTGNINSDPLYMNADDLDLRIKAGASPCQNKGVSGSDVPMVDFLGVSRPSPVDGAVDMGAYETASPIASFKYVMDPVTATPPVTVEFSSTSTADDAEPITAWAWDFGDSGSSDNTSIEENPTHVYASESPNSYVVTLTVTSAAGTSTTTQTITTYEMPAAAFALTPTSGPAPLTVTVADVSTGDYDTCAWDFGDGTVVEVAKGEAAPTHTYSTPGQYDVCLTVSRENASNTACKSDSEGVTVYTPSAADFVANTTSGVGNVNVKFTDKSTGDYDACSWDFGDGTAAVTSAPGAMLTHTFTSAGVFTVTLTISGNGGQDVEEKTDLITIYGVSSAAFTGTPVAGAAELTVTFTDQSTGEYTSGTWDFGDGSATVALTPKGSVQHTYTAVGTYNVKLNITGIGGSSVKLQKSYIRVHNKVHANFTANPVTGVAGTSVVFANTSTGDVASYQWDFGDGSDVSTEANPTHVFSKKGVFTVKLTAIAENDTDTKTSTNLVTMTAPIPAFTASASSVIAPASVCFTNASTGYFESLVWDFGDGTTVTQLKGEADPCHTYTTKGVYDVTLTMVGPEGSENEVLTKTNLITVYAPTNAVFTADRESGSTPLIVIFTNNSTGDYSSGTWNFGDGSATVPASATVTHTYATAGSFTASLSLSGNGGSDTESKEINVYSSVVPAFTADAVSGIYPLTVTFTDNSTGDYQSAQWDYGDGSAAETTVPGATTSHAYSAEGKYTVTLTLTGKGAVTPAVLKKTNYITVYKPAQAAFKSDKTTGVANLAVTFTDQSTGDYDSVTWDFGDGSDPQTATVGGSVTHTYAAKGVYSVKLTITGNGAPTSVSVTKADFITVYAASSAAFTSDKQKGVVPFDVTFTDASTGDYSTMTWDFGDSTVLRLNKGAEPPTHTYTTKGNYTVTLTVEGDGGTNKVTKTQYIAAYTSVTVNASANVTEGSYPLTVTFTDASTGDYDKAKWDFGDETSIVETVPPTKTAQHVFTKAGTFTTTMTIADKDGVEQTKNVTIKVYAPANAEFSANPSQGAYPLTVTFTDLSTGEYDSATWNFGDGSDPVVKKPVVKTLQHTYTKKGDYTVSLTISGNGGTDTESKTGVISVAKAVASAFTASVRSGVAPLTVKFTNSSTGDYDTSSWDFDCDGTQDSGVQSPSYTYSEPGVYNVSLTVSGSGGTNSATKSEYIKVYSPTAADFSATPTSGLAPLEVQFTNLSSGDYSSFAWDFDSDGNVDSTLRDPSYTYKEAGVYTVTLTATGNGGTNKKVRSQFISAYKPILNVGATTVQLGSWAGSAYPITIKNGGNGVLKWKATVLTGADWMSVSPTTEYTGPGELLLSYTENYLATARTATITVEAADAENSPVTITVTQAGKGSAATPALSISPTDFSVDSSTGTASSNVSNSGGGTLQWTASVREGSAWMSVIGGATGSGSGSIELSYAANELSVSRKAVIRVRNASNDDNYVDITVTQASAPVKPELNVTPTTREVGKASGSASFDVYNPNGGTMYWSASVTSGSEWLSITIGTQGTSDGTIIVAYKDNKSSSSRTGVIKVASSNANGSPVEIKVTQEGIGAGCHGSISDSSIGFSGDAFLMMLAAATLAMAGSKVSRRSVKR